MFGIIKKGYGLKPPLGGVNWGNGLSDKLISAILLNEGGGLAPIDSVWQTQGLLQGTTGLPAWTDAGVSIGGRGGKALSFVEANAQSVHWPGTQYLNIQTGPFTVMGWIHLPQNSDNNQRVFTKTDANVAGGWGVTANGGGGAEQINFFVVLSTSNHANSSGNATAPTDKLYQFACVWDFATKTSILYINGIPLSTVTNGSGTATESGNHDLIIGDGAFGGSHPYNGIAERFYIWTRKLNASEIAALYVNPNAMHQSRTMYSLGTGTNNIVGATGIPSAEAFGSVGGQVGDVQRLQGSAGIISAEAFGSTAAEISNTIQGTAGIHSAEAFGANGSINTQFIVGSTGIPSAEAFGVTGGALVFGIHGNYGIPSAEAFGPGAIILRPFTVFVDGVDRTGFMLANSLQINNPLSNSMTAQFQMFDPSGADPTVVPQVGQEVLVYRKGVRVFGGSVEKPGQGAYMASSSIMLAGNTAFGSGGMVQCTDFSNLLDRRYVGKYYDAFLGGSLSAIVRDIVNTILAADGFTYDEEGDPGVPVPFPDQLFNWVTVRQAFNSLSSLTGWDFNVDPYRVIRFFPKGTALGAAPFNILDNNGTYYAESLVVTFDRGTYRNRQGVRNTTQQNPLWCDIFSTANPGPYPSSPQPPDGIRTVFFTLYPINATPTVTVNGVAQKVVSLLDISLPSSAGAQFLWDPPQGGFPGGNFVESTVFRPVLTSSDVLEVCYPTTLSPIVWVQDNAQIAARAAVEGGTGIYEDVQDAPNTMTDPDAQLAYAEALLSRYGSSGIPFTVSYITRQDGLIAGQTQTVHISNPAINKDCVILQVQMRDVDATFFEYTVQLQSGEYLGDWTQFFAALVARSQQPQPTNRSVYSFLLAPSYPGITNPGVTGGYETPQESTVQQAVEIVLYMQIQVPSSRANTGDVGIVLLQNTNGILATTVPAGASGQFTAYATQTIRVFLGDILRILVTGGGISPITDWTITVVTAVTVN